MKFTLLLVATLLLIFSAFGQIVPPSLPEMQEKEDWQTFVPAEEFTLEIPGAATFGIVNAATADTIQSRSYIVFADGSYYYIFSDNLKTPYQYTMALKFAESNAPGIRQDVIYNFSDSFGFHHKVLMVKTDNRIYTFQSVSPTKDNPSTARFFSGIRIKGKLIQPENVVAQNTLQPTSTDTNIQSGAEKVETGKNASSATSQTTPLGNGIGSGSGSSGNASTTSSPAPKSTTSIKILSKPRPPYTDYARFYQVAGIVRIRVTFLANGTIGTVTPATKLPFGLTEEAVKAARLITFEPPTRESIPFTATKLVEYNFLIY